MKPPDELFDEKFGTIKHRGFPQQAIKSFIKENYISKQELLGWIEGMKFVDPNQAGQFAMYAAGYNEALDDIRDKIGG